MTFFEFIRQKENELPSDVFSKLCVVYVQKQDEEDCSSSLMETIDKNKIDIGFDVYTQLTKEYIRTSRTTQDTKKRALEEREQDVEREEESVREKRRKLHEDKKRLDEEMDYAARLSQQVETKPTTAVGSVVFQNNSQTFVLKAYKVGDVYFYSETVNGVEEIFLNMNTIKQKVLDEKLIKNKDCWFECLNAFVEGVDYWVYTSDCKWGAIRTNPKRGGSGNVPINVGKVNLEKFFKKHGIKRQNKLITKTNALKLATEHHRWPSIEALLLSMVVS